MRRPTPTLARNMPVDVPSPIDLRRMDDAVAWEATATARRPCRAEFFDAFTRDLGGASRVLELGSGPGFLAEHLLRARPGVHLVLLDFSPAMHELARRRLGTLLQRVTLVERDFKSVDWPAGLGYFDAVITNQAVHELRHKQHAPILHTQVRKLLKPGGRYLVCDHLAGPGWMSNTDLYMTVDEQRSALESAGIAHVREVLCKEGMVLHNAT